MAILMAGAVELPCPASISINDELIWSSNTGRTTSGEMVGDIVAEKKNLDIKWGVLPEQQVQVIKDCLKPGFFPITFQDGGTMLTIQSYRGTMSKEQLGQIGDGIFYYRSVSVSIIEK